MRWCVPALLILLFASPATGAGFGVDVQAYPAGGIFTARRSLAVGPGETAIHLGYNLTERRDFGEHEDESGGGFGLGLAWRHPWRQTRVVFGARVDLWFLEIDWEDPGRTSRTNITVLQPTAHVGYFWPLGEKAELVAHLSFGAEFNVNTQGEDVGEGLILLLGLTLSR